VDDQGDQAATGFAEYVLRSALQAPSSASPQVAAHTIAGLIWLLTAEGADREVASILAPVPGGPATFEVRAIARPLSEESGRVPIPTDRPANRHGRVVRRLDVGRALREASTLAQDGADVVTVVAVTPDGLRRRILERRGAEPFGFVPPTEDAFEGSPAACAEAVYRWHRHLSEPTPTPVATPGPEPPTPVATPGPEPTEPSPNPTPALDLSAIEHLVSNALRDAIAVIPAPAHPIDIGAIEQVVDNALSDVTVAVDMGAVERVVADALRHAITTTRAQQPDAAIDTAAIERIVADALHHAITTTRAREPAVVNDPPGGWVTHAALIGAADQFHLLLEAFNDRVRSGIKSLEALADELAARERSAAAFTDELGKSIDASMERLGRHIDDRLDRLTEPPVPGPEPAARPPGPGQDSPAERSSPMTGA
jgi:hypothetical protein